VDLPVSILLQIRSKAVMGTQSTDLGKGLISLPRWLEMLCWLNWAKIKALEVVTPTL